MKRAKYRTFCIEKEKLLFIVSLFLIFDVWSCSSERKVYHESWIEKSISEWPDFALTNEISFGDTTFKDIANSFLIDTGKDTLAVSTKHLFMAFEGRFGINSIDLGEQFRYWRMYPKNKPEKMFATTTLINTNPVEPIGLFNTLKSRDWILFEVQELSEGLYPLKIRYEPVRKNEIIYAIGWSAHNLDNKEPARIELKCFQQMGNYFYIQTITPNVNPHGRSGSAVIDKGGYLVGIVSGAEGNLGVIGSVDHLREIFDRYNVSYQMFYPID